MSGFHRCEPAPDGVAVAMAADGSWHVAFRRSGTAWVRPISFCPWCGAELGGSSGMRPSAGEREAAATTSRKRGGDRRARPVRCVETGEIFPTQQAAADSVGVSQASVSACCRGKSRTAGGYRWEFADRGERER